MEQNPNEEVLIFEDKEKKTLSVVSEIDEKTGKVKTVAPKDENNQKFLKINPKEGMLKNFMQNFLRQYNDPTRFGLYQITSNKIEESIAMLTKMLKNPNAKENADTLENIRVNFDEFTPTKEFKKIDESRVTLELFEDIGVNLDTLKKSGELDKMLEWQKTSKLLPITLKAGEEEIRTSARLALRENEEGDLIVAIHALRQQPDLERPYMGLQFTDEDKKNLMETGNLGRVVELKPSEREPFKAFVSIDALTNELLAVRSERIRIPDEILGVQLSEEQKQQLSEGKAVKVEGMTSKKGKEFSATLQANADKKGLEFRFDNMPKFSERHTQQNTQSSNTISIPKKFCGIEVSEKQHQALINGKTLYLKGMTNKEGETFNSYVKYSEKDNRLRFYKNNPDKTQQQENKQEQKTEQKEDKAEKQQKSRGRKR